MGLLLIKSCFENSEVDTLTYEDLTSKLKSILKELKDEKIKRFIDIAGFPLSEFLTRNKERFTVNNRRGKQCIKLKVNRVKTKRQTSKKSSADLNPEAENKTLHDSLTFENMPCQNNILSLRSNTEGSCEQWTEVVRSKKRSKRHGKSKSIDAQSLELSCAKSVTPLGPKVDIEVEKFKSLLNAPVDRDHSFVPCIDVYKQNRLKFTLDIVSMWNTPQRTSSFIVLGVEEGCELPHKLISLQDDVDDDFFQSLFEKEIFTFRPVFTYHNVKYLDGIFGFFEIQSSYGFGQPCIATKGAIKDDTVIKEDELWFRHGTINAVCKHKDLNTVSVYQWFAGTGISLSKSGTSSQHSKETHLKNAGTSTNEFEETKGSSRKSACNTFDYFWEQVQSFQKGRFVLISGDVQNKHRGLEALSLIPWIAVYDFDIHSASDGLLNATKDSIERKRSLHITTWNEPAQCLSEQATCWCFMRGRREISDSRTDGKKGHIEDAMTWFKMTRRGIQDNCEQLASFSEDYTVITIVLIWPENEKLVPTFQKFICRLNECLNIIPKIVVIMTKEPTSESARSRFTIFREDYLDSIVVCELDIETVCLGIMSKLAIGNPQKHAFSLPTADSKNDLSLSDKDAAWLKEDLDVLYIDNPYSTGEKDEKELQEAVEAFYRGVPLHWRIRYECPSDQADIERDKMKQLEITVKRLVENFKTVVITLYHQPGSGGTTLAQSVLWKFHGKYPCVHLKLRSATNIDELSRRVAFLNKKTQLPVIMLIDGEEESKVLYLSKRLQYAILLYVKRYPYKIQNDTNGSKVFLEGLVSATEASKLLVKFGENCDDVKKKALERLNEDVQKQKQEHHLYEFGLTRFQLEFHGIVSFVQGYLQLDENPTDELLPWQKCLGFLALVYYYGQASVPCQFFAKLMNKLPNYSLALEDFPHQFTQFVTFDRNQGKKDHIRICHYIVAKEILEQILSRHSKYKCTRTDTLGIVASRKLSRFAIDFIDYSGGKKTKSSSQTSTIKFILTKTFIFREDRILEDNEDQKRKRPLLSKLLTDIPSDQPLFTERLRVLEKLTSSFPDDPNFLAHLGRFYAFCRPDDDALAEKYSKKAVDLCQKQVEGVPLHCVDDCMRLTLMHVYHMYAHIKRKAISRYTGWSEKDKAQIRTKADQFIERLEELASLADTACLYYQKSREATPETHCAYFHAYTDEIKVRLQICEFVRKQTRKQSGDETIQRFFESDSSRNVKTFIKRSVHVIESLIMECYMDFELLNEEIQFLQHLVMWYNSMFQEKAIKIDTQGETDDDDISHRCLQIALIKLKYGTRSTFGNIQNVTDKDDVNTIVQLLEEIFDQTQRYGLKSTYGRHELERDFRDWIYAIRHDCFHKVYDIESVLGTLQLWQDKTNSPLSRYYIFIMKSLLGFGSEDEQGKTECLMEAETCREELIKMKRLIIRPKYPREWLGRHGKGIKRLLYGKRFIGNSSLTSENEAVGTHLQPSALAVCKGTILSPNTNRIGSYIEFDLGVNTVRVFYLPKMAKLEGSRYVGHRVEFNLAFSLEHGYEAYNVALLRSYGCPNCSARLEFTSDTTELYCKCGTPVYKDELNESRTETTDS